MASQTLLVVELTRPEDVDTHSGHDSASVNQTMQQMTKQLSKKHNLDIEFLRSGDPDTAIQLLTQKRHFDGLIINLEQIVTSASEKDLDTMRSLVKTATDANKPVIEVRFDNSFTSPVSSVTILRPNGLVCGFGRDGYVLAIRSIAQQLSVEHGK